MNPLQETSIAHPTPSLQDRKQQLVRDAIREAAMDLFAEKGFEQTTVEEIATAAGVSRRSFFRYFASKNDLMGQDITAYGIALSTAIAECPATYSPLETLRDVVLRIVTGAAKSPGIRKVIAVAKSSPGARQAQLSQKHEVEDRVFEAYAARLGSTSDDQLTPRLLSDLTLSILDVTFRVWFDQEEPDITQTAERVIASLTGLICNNAISPRP